MNNILEILKDPTIKIIYNDSKANSIPLIRDKTAVFLLEQIKKYNIKTCLEVGTAFGFSAAVMGILGNVEVTTLEKDPIRNMKAVNYLKPYKNIHCELCDCFEFNTNEKFDLLFIDGPKANQINLFKKLVNNLDDNGIVIIDNIYLNNIANLEAKTPNQEKLLNAVHEFRSFLEHLEDFKCSIVDIDDGVALLERK